MGIRRGAGAGVKKWSTASCAEKNCAMRGCCDSVDAVGNFSLMAPAWRSRAEVSMLENVEAGRVANV